MPDEERQSGLLLLDTSVLTLLTDPGISHPEWDPLVTGKALVVSFVTVGETLHGAMKANWGPKRIAAMEARLRAYPVIPGTVGVARKYAELRRWFFQQVGENDLWIAACALTQPDPLPLATADSDFDSIAERFPLQVVRPSSAEHS